MGRKGLQSSPLELRSSAEAFPLEVWSRTLLTKKIYNPTSQRFLP